MSPPILAAQTTSILLALWLGSFLLARDPTRPALRNAGLGLVVYALALTGTLFGSLANQSAHLEMARQLVRLANPLLFLPAILWAGTLVHLLPENAPNRHLFVQGWRYSLPVLVGGFLLLGAGTDWIFGPDGRLQGAGYWVAGFVALLPLIEVLILMGIGFLRRKPRTPLGLLLAVLLFFTLSAALLVIPKPGLPRIWLLLGMGVDLILLGLAVAALDAFDEGEAWLPELLRSLMGALAALIFFAGPVALTMRLATGTTPAMVALLLSIGAAAVLAQTLRSPIQASLDNLAYAPFPRLRRAQTELRNEAQAQTRLSDALDPASMDGTEFTRLTRRALSHFGNLPKLAASPLTQLWLVEQRVQEKGLRGDTLERAAILKELLTESIDRLRPPNGEQGFSNKDEWRHYNALHYPYVAGLRPYSRRANLDNLSPDEAAALDWLRTDVPERTLYNWQSAAAELVAQDLLDRSRGTQA